MQGRNAAKFRPRTVHAFFPTLGLQNKVPTLGVISSPSNRKARPCDRSGPASAPVRVGAWGVGGGRIEATWG